MDLEAGDLAIDGWQGDTIRPRTWMDCRDFAVFTLGALNAEIVINADGAMSVALDLRGTFNLTVELAGSVDGTNWTLLAVRSMAGGS